METNLEKLIRLQKELRARATEIAQAEGQAALKARLDKAGFIAPTKNINSLSVEDQLAGVRDALAALA